MALNAYLRIKGQEQGEIKGSATQKGREARIVVIECSHEVTSMRDPTSGRPIGRRQHFPVAITKELDRSSVPLREALVTNELLTEWELQFWRPLSRGTEKQHFTIRLIGATVTSIDFIMPNTRDSTTAKIPEVEEIAFSYERIEWIWTDGLVAGDDWAGTES